MSWTNADGLTILMHEEQGEVNDTGSTVNGIRNQLVIEIPDATLIPSSVATPSPLDAFIPANSYITGAYIISETTFTSGGAATLTVGLYEQDATVIDADGIDATVALAALTAGDVVVCDGALAGGVLTVGSADAYVECIYGTAAFTAGAAKIVIDYITV